MNDSSFFGVKIIAIICILTVVITKSTLVAIIFMIEKNKVKVLSLYSEIKVKDARSSLLKCQTFL
jgi:hypothetical protein